MPNPQPGPPARAPLRPATNPALFTLRSMVSFLPLDISDEDSIDNVLLQVDQRVPPRCALVVEQYKDH